jgi:AcrR family transcriptional regulator
VKSKNPRNSGATKARILEAAREAFATLGYERATVRTIAEMAHIHPSMVMRYYASKESLFAASSQFNLQLPDFAKAHRAKAGELIVQTFLDRWENRGAAGDLPALLRLSVTHPDGREKLIAVYTKQVKPALDRLIPPKRRARVAILIATQLVGLAFLRYVLRLPAAIELTEEDIVKSIGGAIQGYIDVGSAPY